MKDVIKTQQSNDEYKTINGQRMKVNRRKRRSNLKSFYALAIIFAAMILMVLCMTIFFNIKRINVNGAEVYSRDQIMLIGGVSLDDNLVRTNTDVVEKRLSENLAYIDDVKVTKVYPSTMTIEITQAEKAVEIEHKGKYYVMSKSGKILESGNDTHNKKLPLVKGFELKSLSPNQKVESEDAFKTKILTEMLDKIENLEFKKIKVIDLTDRADITLDYDGRIEILLGSSVDMDYKLTYIKAVIEKSLADGFNGTIRYNGLTSGISAIPSTDSSSKTDKKDDEKSENSGADDSSANDVEDSSSQANVDANTDVVTQPTEPSQGNYDDSQAENNTGVDENGEYSGWQQGADDVTDDDQTTPQQQIW